MTTSNISQVEYHNEVGHNEPEYPPGNYVEPSTHFFSKGDMTIAETYRALLEELGTYKSLYINEARFPDKHIYRMFLNYYPPEGKNLEISPKTMIDVRIFSVPQNLTSNPSFIANAGKYIIEFKKKSGGDSLAFLRLYQSVLKRLHHNNKATSPGKPIISPLSSLPLKSPDQKELDDVVSSQQAATIEVSKKISSFKKIEEMIKSSSIDVILSSYQAIYNLTLQDPFAREFVEESQSILSSVFSSIINQASLLDKEGLDLTQHTFSEIKQLTFDVSSRLCRLGTGILRNIFSQKIKEKILENKNLHISLTKILINPDIKSTLSSYSFVRSERDLESVENRAYLFCHRTRLLCLDIIKKLE